MSGDPRSLRCEHLCDPHSLITVTFWLLDNVSSTGGSIIPTSSSPWAITWHSSIEVSAFWNKTQSFPKNLVNKSVQPSKNGSYKNIQGFSKSGTNAYARNPKPVVAQEGKRSTICRKQQKLEIVLPYNQRALWAAAINFCSSQIKRRCHLETTRRYQEVMVWTL